MLDKVMPRILIDTREQTPFHFGEHPTMSTTLPFGDYSIEGFSKEIVLERKALGDFLACVGRERERFEKELLALRGYRFKAVIIETDLKTIHAGKWRGDIKPQQVTGSINGWRAKHQIEFIYGGNADLAAIEAFIWLRKSYDHIYECTKRFIN